ncbi:hypothetical protein EV182_000183 [Spiromyces aspiralis]|uniref:Uncharacterized protein n=1 Tax=Spiromyces aspiralis TaxID=68401 RepID=A0ACC1HYZ1_9FUNG|nr:hypothetical protein EV182_000183 [Spiromyces aspiralis]
MLPNDGENLLARLNGLVLGQHSPATASATAVDTAVSSPGNLIASLSRNHSNTSLSAAGSVLAHGPALDLAPLRCLQSLTQRPHTGGHGPPPWSDASLHSVDSSSFSSSAYDNDSVLALAATDDYIFSGSQGGQIYVWDRNTYQLVHIVAAHKRTVLALTLDSTKDVLFSAGGDSKVKAWCTRSFRCLYVVNPGDNVGAVLSLAYSAKHDLLILGCQNTSIQWFAIGRRHELSKADCQRELVARRSNFFDSAASCVVVDESLLRSIKDETDAENREDLALSRSEDCDEYVIFDSSIANYAHHGYVYALFVGFLPNISNDEEVLVSAAGDGIIKLWLITERGIEHIRTLSSGSDAACNIHSLLMDDELLVAGLQGGLIEVWDLETFQKIKTLHGHTDDVLALAIYDRHLFSASADGTTQIWGPNFERVASYSAHPGEMALSMIVLPDEELVVTGGSDNTVKFWEIPLLSDLTSTTTTTTITTVEASGRGPVFRETLHGAAPRRKLRNQMLTALSQWVAIRSVPDVPELQTECRRAARFLRDLMRQLGATDSYLIPGAEGRNPLVYGRFSPRAGHSSPFPSASAMAPPLHRAVQGANRKPPPPPSSSSPLAHDAVAATGLVSADAPTVLVYGHYDVMPPGEATSWDSDPFTLSGRGGYLYGRGVTDNKGPVLATLFAVAELWRNDELDMDVVFCIEGEEEAGSIGFYDAIMRHSALFGRPKLILLSSAYWLGEKFPCLTYGMRGSIRATIEIQSSRMTDVHSGVWGGAAAEPLTWLSHILSRLSSVDGKVLVPGFEDDVRPVTSEEEKHMRELVHHLMTGGDYPAVIGEAAPASPTSSMGSGARAGHDLCTEDQVYNQLMARWRFPTLSVHHVTMSTSASPANSTLVPAGARADISVRIVPNQDIQQIAEQLRSYIVSVFDQLKSSNILAKGSSKAGICPPEKEDRMRLNLTVRPVARWWLADPQHPFSCAAREAIAAEWSDSAPVVSPTAASEEGGAGKVPLLIREGGSIPAVPWLEEFFGPDTTVINLPMGQSTDNAHMGNERIRLVNLVKGQNIVARLLRAIGPSFAAG